MDQKIYDAGMKMRRQVAGNEYVDKAMANVNDFNRDFQRIVTQYGWGETWGDPTLSPADVRMTQEIIAIAKPLGVTIHDHIIVGRNGHASLKGLRLI